MSVQITQMIVYFYFIETPPSKQKLIAKDFSQTFPGTSSFKRKLDFGTNKCKSLSPKPKTSSKLFDIGSIEMYCLNYVLILVYY